MRHAAGAGGKPEGRRGGNGEDADLPDRGIPIEFRREIDGELFVVLGGIFSIVFGGLLVAFPGAGLLSLTWLVRFWAAPYGFSSLGIAYWLHGINTDLNKARPHRLTGNA